MSNRRKIHKRDLRRLRQQERQQAAPATYWNGERTLCMRGTATIADDTAFPDYWARNEGRVGERVPVVRVDYHGRTSYLLDDEGQGWAKVTVGGGGPRHGHRNVTIEPGSWKPRVPL